MRSRLARASATASIMPMNSAGFAWIEMNAEGVTLAEHARVEEQPRVEVEITTARLFSMAPRQPRQMTTMKRNMLALVCIYYPC